MTLYHLIQGHIKISPNKRIRPYIPKSRLSCEDGLRKRICVSSSLDGCITGIGLAAMGVRFVYELLEKHETDKDFLLTDVLVFPFTVLEFDVDEDSENYMPPEQVQKYVPDAMATGEYWIIRPMRPSRIRKLWLVDGDVEKRTVMLDGETFILSALKNSVWVETKAFPSKKLMINVLKDVEKFLRQKEV